MSDAQAEDYSKWVIKQPDENWREKPSTDENILTSVARAPFRIAGDAVQGIYQGATALPGLMEKAKTEIPGLYLNAQTHPYHMMGQGIAGGLDALNSVAQFPKQAANYATNRLHLLPEAISNLVSATAPEDITESTNSLFGKPQYEGEEMLRGGIGAIPAIAGAKGAFDLLNPMKLTNAGMVKDVLKTKEKLQDKFTGQYNDIWNEAKEKGLGGELIEKPEIDMDTLKQFTPKKKLFGVGKLLEDPTLQNAHFAKSDLLSLQRELDKKTTWNEAEKAQSEAISNAVDNIQDNMFKMPNGKVDEGLLNKYQTTQSAYKNEYVPYKNPAINKYLHEKLTNTELMDALKKGEFMRKRGSYHWLSTKDLLRKAILGGASYEGLRSATGHSLDPFANG